MAFSDIIKKEKMLGIAGKKRRYDLPLNKSPGTRFLVLLIGLMTFLAMLAMAASFTLSAMKKRWNTGLQDQVTIEIPAETESGALRPANEMDKLVFDIAVMLKQQPHIENVSVMSDEDIAELVSPWLGNDISFDNIPIPGLITIELDSADPAILSDIHAKIKNLTPNVTLDTHEEWLNDLFRFTGSLQFTSTLLMIIVGITTIIAIAGAVRSRLAIHHEEVELLHLMGATDNYISNQFQMNILSLSIQGAIFGTLFGALVIMIIRWISGEMGVSLLPSFSLSFTQFTILAILPVLIAAMAALTARLTVLRALAQMP